MGVWKERFVLAERFDAAQEQVSNDLYASELMNSSEEDSRFNGYIVLQLLFLPMT